MSRLNYNVSNSNPLIPRQQTYVLDRKLVTIHSEDRDIKKYPCSNHFTIQLPAPLENVQSVRLVECSLPINHYVFSRQYQNTKMSFIVNSMNMYMPHHGVLATTSASNRVMTIEIQEGYYCPEELATELQERMNQAVIDKIAELGSPASTYNEIKVYYDKVGQRFWFGSRSDELILLFDRKEEYCYNCYQPVMWDNTVNWGLGWYLGFERCEYVSSPALDGDGNPTFIKFNYLGPHGKWLIPRETVADGQQQTPVNFIVAPVAPSLFGEDVIYMSLNKFNSMDELIPGPTNTNSQHNNTWNAIVNSAFAKIPVTNKPLGQLTDSRNGFLQNITHMDVPEEKITKLDILFRYHDGRHVDFGNNRFNFTLEFNCLKNEIGKDLAVRIPLTYNL